MRMLAGERSMCYVGLYPCITCDRIDLDCCVCLCEMFGDDDNWLPFLRGQLKEPLRMYLLQLSNHVCAKQCKRKGCWCRCRVNTQCLVRTKGSSRRGEEKWQTKKRPHQFCCSSCCLVLLRSSLTLVNFILCYSINVCQRRRWPPLAAFYPIFSII